MENLKDKTVCVFDTSGQYTAIAQRLGRDFGKVYYCTNWQQSFPKWNTMVIGMGVENIERVDSIWEVYDEIDLFVFPDLYFGSFQKWLREQGKIVFGSGLGENIEIYRDQFFELQEEVGLPVSGYEAVKGITKLRKKLKDKENVWIKTNLIRGNGETFNYKNSRLSESRLDEIQHSLGAYKDEAIFLICEPIDDAIEIGHDTFVIDGNVPEKVTLGLEVKDSSYVGCVQPYEKTHDVIKNIDKKMKPYFEEVNYRGFFSTEVRWNGKKGFWGDATCRCGQPPSDAQTELYDNFSEIIWEVANGRIPEIKSKNRFVAQIIIKSSWATSEPQAVYFPEKYKNNVKLKSLMYKDGVAYYIPIDGFSMEEIGSVVATGKTLKEAIMNAKEISKTVEGDCISINCDSLDEAQNEIDNLKKFNISLF